MKRNEGLGKSLIDTNKELKWFRCKARDMGIDPPRGKVIKFWIGGVSEDSVTHVLTIDKGMKDIEYVKEDDKFPAG
tara:strand:- start:65 stop:292 length:228 start_codon:yes stop_codon:yes gene_type:complete